MVSMIPRAMLSIPLLLLLLLHLLTDAAQAACECGYLDPVSGDLWTDATITYFNETGLSDVVTDPLRSPAIYGQETNGSTGDGQQAWSLIGDHVNEWEDSFGAEWRSAVSYNNTYSSNQSLGLALQVSTPNLESHVVNGSQIVTRRRDIQYGSFRAFIVPTQSYNMNGGSAFTFGVSYNDSETVDVTLYTSDYGNDNHTVGWSYSASGKDASPVLNNLTLVEDGADVQDGLLHRIDWTSGARISLSNSGANTTANSITYVKGENATNLPTTPAPVSFQTWANGEPSQSMGPPMKIPAVTYILYTRFFYNSSLEERNTQFTQQCLAADLLSSLCSTEDLSLRNSTVFSQEATDGVVLPPLVFTVPLYAIIVESIVGGGLLLLVLHVFATRRFFGQTKAVEQPLKNNTEVDAKNGKNIAAEGEVEEIKYAEKKDSAKASGFNSHIAETVLLARRSSISHHGHNGSRRGSSVGHGSSLGHTTLNESKHSLPLYSSRPTSVIHGRDARGPRDITDLDIMFDGWDSDDGYDSDEHVQVERISGNIERYDDHDDIEMYETSSRTHEVEILPLTRPREDISSVTDSHLPSNSTGGEEGAPQIVQWQVRDQGDETAAAQLAEPRTSSDAQEVAIDTQKNNVLAHFPTLVSIIIKRADNFFFVGRTTQVTSTGQRRIDYLDGMRGAACVLVSLGHFTLIFFNGIANPGSYHHYPGFEHWYRYIFGAIGTNASLLLGTFFALPARTACQRYLLKGGLGPLADMTVRRLPRLMLPVLAAALINYFLMDVNAFKWVQRLPSRTWSVWSYWELYDNCLVFANAVITLPWGSPPDEPALVTGYATGVLWTIPVIIQGMWTSMISALIAHEIKSHWKRYTFYFLAVLFSWYASDWSSFFIAGLIVGDLDSKLHYREAAARGIPIPIPRFAKGGWVRIHGKYLSLLFLAACCTQQWISYIPSAPGSDFNFVEHSLHPDWQTSLPYAYENSIGYTGYTTPYITGFFLILALFMAADLFPGIQKFFRLRAFHWLGIHSMSIYLLHGVVWWTWCSLLLLRMLEAGAPYWGAVLASFITGYILLFAVAMCFTYTFEVWAVIFAKAIWRAASGNIGRKV